jgi:hypothetical protein
MRTVKSLLLGGAAGLLAVAAAQAADLPVKAKPVEYVKVCSLYGEGFFYIPGTDTCIKVGGWVRYDQYFGNTGGSGNPFVTGSTGRNDSFDSADYQTRARTVVSFDVRTQTEYGVLQSYYRGGFELTTNFVSQGAYYTERAFVRFAGFIFGKTQSYFDTWAQTWSYGSHAYLGAGANTSGAARNLMAYTATLGNGVSWTIAAEDATSRRGALWDAGTNAMAIGAFPGPNTWGGTGYPTCGFGAVTSDQNIGNAAAPLSVSGSCATGDYAAQSVPDIVGQLRVDQAWGSAQISGALHQVRGNFYGNDVQQITSGPNAFTGVRPSDVWGWAVAGGIVLNLPWNPGDKFWVEGAIGEGTPCYVGICQDDGRNGTYTRFDGGRVAAGWGLDGVFANVVANNAASPAAGGASNFSGILLPTVFDIAAAVEHYWTPTLRTSLFGSFTGWETGAGVPSTPGAGVGSAMNALMCSSPVGPVRTPTGAGTFFAGNAPSPVLGCNYSFELGAIGTRTIWNPVKNLDIGFEIMWSKIYQHMDPNTVRFNFGGGGNRAAGLYAPSDEDIVSGLVRIQRNFWP